MLKIETHSNRFFITAGATLLFSSFSSTNLLNNAIKVDIFAPIYIQIVSVLPFLLLFSYSACLVGHQIANEKISISLQSLWNKTAAVAAVLMSACFVLLTLFKNNGLLLWPSPIPISLSLYLLLAFVSFLCSKIDTKSAIINSCAVVIFYMAVSRIYLHVLDEWASLGFSLIFLFLLSAIKLTTSKQTHQP